MAEIEENKSYSLSDFDEDENLLESIEEEEPKNEEEPIIKSEPEEGEEEKPIEEEPEEEDPKEELEKKEEEPETTKEEETEVEEEDPLAFWNDVDKINGTSIEVDFKGLDPTSPEGAAIREQAVVDYSIDLFLNRMKETHPKVYQAFEYETSGGKIEDLFTPGEKDYSNIVLKDDDEDHAKQIIQEYYIKKGVTDTNKLKKLIQIEEDSEEGLIAIGKSYLKELTEIQEQIRNDKQKKQELSDQRQKEKDTVLLNNISTIISSGNLGGLIVNKKEGNDFYQEVNQRIQRLNDGKYIIYSSLNEDELETQLKYEYFRFKKGDLSKLIDAKAETKNVKRLKRNIESSTTTPKSTQKIQKRKLSMKDFEQD